ncbi:aspartate-semialdehyde dehydrogenase [Methanomicrobiaceae archaeon CYW5]|uniref:aspartate-semialdehyde dehydrogenase n=1 Tax=Methanovulcanius yangii TaxID=1789227 RepID=UPI0029C9DF5F|nr:aspartate-semialdehyde dehydrogenase [Methanovulcanius yangii]MBT8507700.1 aspartate-semialdehyde dehydrogenase [Methanovulcanius yangii]
MINVGVLGATGAVGQRFVQLLAGHPWFNLTTLTASERSAGKKYKDVVNWRLDVPFPEETGELVVRPTTVESIKDLDLVFSALPANIAGEIESAAAQAGVGVCSNASSHRMDPDVPLVIPEVNHDHLGLIDVQRDAGKDGFIVANPNCSTIVLCMSLEPIRSMGLRDVKVATMQAISGAGFEGIAAMSIYENVVPFIGSEEEKMESEPLKIMGSFDGAEIVPASFTVSASCNRVPVIDGHTMAIWADIDATVDEVIAAFSSYCAPFSGLPHQPAHSVLYLDAENRPQPRLDRNRGDGMTVSVGRVREGLRYVAMGHNTIRGAAGASVLNAELIASKKYL